MIVAPSTRESITPARSIPSRVLTRDRNSPPPTLIDEDDLIRRSAQRKFRESGYFVLRDVQCRVEQGIVTLFGTVPSYYMKQIAQTIILRMEGAEGVQNFVVVEKPTK